MNQVLFNLHMLLLSNEIDPEKIKEISRRTNMITTALLIIVGAVFLIFVVYLVYFHKTTKRVKRSTVRFNDYKSVTGTITDVEMVSYFVKLYEKPPEKQKADEIKISQYIGEQNEKYIKSSNPFDSYKSFDKDKTEKKEIEKIRFKVRYEFSTDSSNLYSGECFVYEKNDNIAKGKPIEIKYNPENPMVNFTSYSAPVGTQ